MFGERPVEDHARVARVALEHMQSRRVLTDQWNLLALHLQKVKEAEKDTSGRSGAGRRLPRVDVSDLGLSMDDLSGPMGSF